MMLATSPGCGKKSADTQPAIDDGDALKQGEQIAEKMLAAYRKADSYTDHATYVQHSVLRGEGVERDLPFFQMSIAFDRPNRLRLSFEEAVESSAGRQGFDVASNGSIMRCRAGELAEQVLESAAPLEITTENLLPDPLIREVFANRALGDVFPQLAMLLDDDRQSPVFPEDEAPRLIGKGELRGRPCFRVASTSPKGKRVLWIDRETYALHRMELPIDAERATLDAGNQYSQLAVWIDFEDATFDAQIDAKSFEMEIPADARRVRRFVAPPPAAPPEVLGKQIADFAFKTLDDKEVTPASLAGKAVLLDFWQVDCAPCKAHTPDLDAIYRELKAGDKFAFYAVNLDGLRIVADYVERTLKSWGGTMPVLLDPKQDALKRLNIEGTPTLVLIDSKGRLQHFHVRKLEDPQEFAKLIRRVIDGADLAAEARAEHRQLTKDYDNELEAATIKDSILDIEVARPEGGQRKLPEKHAASELWQAKPEDVTRPGNTLILPAGGDNASPRIFAVDGGQAIIELDEAGVKLARHEIPSASGKVAVATGPSANGFLRTVAAGDGKRWFAVSGVGWQQVHVFDPAWKHVLAFPEDRNPGIADVQLIKQGGQDQPRLCIGYWGGVGVQGVDLDGKRKWSERSLDQVVQVARVPKSAGAADDEFELWCTSSRGTILVLDRQGKPQREIVAGLNNIMHVAVAEVDDALECCGLAVESVARYRALGFSPDGKVAWQYDLPTGEYAYQVERIQQVTLPGDKSAWMIAAANGAILWLDRQGQLIDEFHYGKPLTGLSLTNSGDEAILLVSTPETLTAWKLTTSKP